jgi:hypothetical protein
MGAGSGAEPGLTEWRLGGMATGGDIFESRASEGWEGGRAAVELAPEAAAAAVGGAGAKDKEEIEGDVRGIMRGAGRENWTETDSLPPSVSTAPPKSKASFSDGCAEVSGTAVERM